MSLNNNGWGIRVVFAFILVLFIALFVFYSMLNGNNIFDGELNRFNETYESIENNIRKASIEYQAEYYKNIEDNEEFEKLTIQIERLIETGFLDNVKDVQTGKECSGYVLLERRNDNIEHISYIKCDSYTTNGYEEFMDE